MNIIGMKFTNKHWEVLYCVPAAPEDPPIYCAHGILEVWTPLFVAKGRVVNPRALLDYMGAA